MVKPQGFRLRPDRGGKPMSQLTKKAIKASFVHLLNERPLDKITVKDIVEDCGINRNTFYYYYQDIYALLEEVFIDETQQALSADFEIQSWQEGVYRTTNFAMKNKRMIFHVYNSRSREELEQYLSKTIGWVVRKYIQTQTQGLHVSQSDIDLITLFYQHAIKGLLLDWVGKGMKEEPKDYLDRLGVLFDGNIRMILERAEKNPA